MSALAPRVRRHFHRSALGWAVTLGCLLLAPGALAAVTAGSGGVTFTHTAPQAGEVFLAGDFNGWNATANPMNRDDGGVWTLTVELKPGDHEYKFIVDGNWVEDPDNPRRQSDPFGGHNSLVTVAPDGTLAGTADAPAPSASTSVAAPAGEAGAPRAVDGGILFTYREPAAGQVFLAGSFNGWSASQTAMSRGDKGVWSVVQPLDEGLHEYKFVVDGNWVADPENPDTQSDPYGGVNSVVNVGADGKLTAAPAAAPDATASSALALNAKMTLDGRYLTRFELAKNVQSDPRYRLLRPSMSVDLNFRTAVNDVVDSYMRLRMDSNENVILNNITSNLDEAHLHVHPGQFDVIVYWNQEIFTSDDPLNLVGNIDHPATIGHDHLDLGKGTAGAVLTARPFGLDFTGYFANVHNFDYYNDPDLYDNTGGDRVYARFSHELGPVEIGLPLWLQREMLWLNFESLVGQPSTGIPALDQYLQGGDSSTWFEADQHDYKVGLDAALPMNGATSVLSGQVMYVDQVERFVTGNQAGQNNVNGSIDVPFLEREEVLAGLRWDWRPEDGITARVQHTLSNMSGADPDQRSLLYSFSDQATAENRVNFSVGESPAQTKVNLTEVEAAWLRGDRDLRLYLWRSSRQEDYGDAGRLVPGTADRTSRTLSTWYLSGLAGKGSSDAGWGHAELEFGVTLQDPDVEGEDFRSYELIGRYSRDISRSVTALADVRYIRYETETNDPTSGESVQRDEGFWSPFVGLQYRPIPRLEMVLGYGLDPVELSIDYRGRQFGRWWYRQQYLFDNPGADLLDAEQHLADARIFTLRAQMTF